MAKSANGVLVLALAVALFFATSTPVLSRPFQLPYQLLLGDDMYDSTSVCGNCACPLIYPPRCELCVCPNRLCSCKLDKPTQTCECSTFKSDTDSVGSKY